MHIRSGALVTKYGGGPSSELELHGRCHLIAEEIGGNPGDWEVLFWPVRDYGRVEAAGQAGGARDSSARPAHRPLRASLGRGGVGERWGLKYPEWGKSSWRDKGGSGPPPREEKGGLAIEQTGVRNSTGKEIPGE